MPKSTTKEKVRRKRGEQIRQKKVISKIKRSKQERDAKKQAAAARPTKKPVLLRHETDTAGSGEIVEKPRRASSFTDRMDVDDFMEHGFMKAWKMQRILRRMLMSKTMRILRAARRRRRRRRKRRRRRRRRRRHRRRSRASCGHKAELEALAKSDPEFYEYMRKTDKGLLDFADEDARTTRTRTTRTTRTT